MGKGGRQGREQKRDGITGDGDESRATGGMGMGMERQDE